MSPTGTSKVSTLIHKAFSLHQQGKIDKAEKHYRKALKLEPQNFDALQGLGAIAIHKKQYQPAIKFLESAVAINPVEPGLLTNLGLAYKHNGNKTRAREYFEKSTRINNTFGPAYYNLALLEMDENHFQQALETLYESERCRPGHIPTLTSIAYTLTRLGLNNEAISYFRHATKLDPDNANLHFELAKSCLTCRLDSEAIDELRKAIAINPGHADARAKLADVFESNNRIDDALSEAEQVLSTSPGNPLANLVTARIERRQGNLQQAKNRLIPLSADITNEQHEDDISAGILTELGFVHDRLEQYNEAFQAFRQANQIMASLPENQAIDPRQAYRFVDAYSSWLVNIRQTERHPFNTDDDDLPSPVFLVGFPRSGTTLTEQILAAHQGISTGDELPVLHHMTTSLSQILGRDVDYPACLDKLTGDDVHRLRQYYWDQISPVLGESVSNHLFIDKMPLNIIHLPFINRIFPGSKIIVALRDPRDVCLSCFMQQFLVNESMLQFLNIKSTAKYYAAVMGLWLQYRELLAHKQLQLDWIESRYEDIVSDVLLASERLFDFLGIDKNQVTGEYHQQAAKRSISTPSYQDVSSPIYQRAMGRWQNYRNQLEPVLDDLSPFIRAFEYPMSQKL